MSLNSKPTENICIKDLLSCIEKENGNPIYNSKRNYMILTGFSDLAKALHKEIKSSINIKSFGIHHERDLFWSNILEEFDQNNLFKNKSKYKINLSSVREVNYFIDIFFRSLLGENPHIAITNKINDKNGPLNDQKFESLFFYFISDKTNKNYVATDTGNNVNYFDIIIKIISSDIFSYIVNSCIKTLSVESFAKIKSIVAEIQNSVKINRDQIYSNVFRREFDSLMNFICYFQKFEISSLCANTKTGRPFFDISFSHSYIRHNEVSVNVSLSFSSKNNLNFYCFGSNLEEQSFLSLNDVRISNNYNQVNISHDITKHFVGTDARLISNLDYLCMENIDEKKEMILNELSKSSEYLDSYFDGLRSIDRECSGSWGTKVFFEQLDKRNIRQRKIILKPKISELSGIEKDSVFNVCKNILFVSNKYDSIENIEDYSVIISESVSNPDIKIYKDIFIVNGEWATNRFVLFFVSRKPYSFFGLNELNFQFYFLYDSKKEIFIPYFRISSI